MLGGPIPKFDSAFSAGQRLVRRSGTSCHVSLVQRIKNIGWVAISLAAIFVLCGQARADDVGGVVRDAQGNPVPGITIVIAKPPDHPLSQATTDDKGKYLIYCLTDGDYFIELKPNSTPYVGQTIVSHVGIEGLKVDWTVSTSAPAGSVASNGEKKFHPECGGWLWGGAA